MKSNQTAQEERPARSPVKTNAEVQVVVNDPTLPIDIKLAERAVRMAKVKQMISSCFRSVK